MAIRQTSVDPGHSVGVYIDPHEALVVRLKPLGLELCKVRFDESQHTRRMKHGKGSSRPAAQILPLIGGNGFENGRSLYLERITAAMRGASRSVLFGPDQMKQVLFEALKHMDEWHGRPVDVVHMNSMTPAQKVAWVKRFFRWGRTSTSG